MGSVWVSVCDFGSLDGYFAMIVEPLRVYESPFSTKIFHDFINLRGRCWVDLGSA